MSNVLYSVCRVCGKPFKTYEWRTCGQKECPTCLAERHVEHGDMVFSIPLQRQIAGAYTCRIHSLPGEWVEMPPKRSHDTPYYKIEVRGRAFGRQWRGQITIFASRPMQVGEVVRARIMNARHRVKALTFTRQTSGLKNAPPSVTHRAILPIFTTEADIPARIESGDLYPDAADGILREEIQERHYIVLHPKVWDGKDEVPFSLVWAEAHTKSTLKGFGAQYRASIDADDAVYTSEVRGGVRSGRAHTIGLLAIVPAGKAIVIRSSGVSGSGASDSAYNWEKHLPLPPEREEKEYLLSPATLAKLRREGVQL